MSDDQHSDASRFGPSDGMDDEFGELKAMLRQAEADAGTDRARSQKRRSRSGRKSRLGAVITALAVVVAAGVYVPMTLLAPIDAVGGSVEAPAVTVPGPFAPAAPFSVASAVSVTGAEEFPGTIGTDGILVSTGDPGPHPIASVSKIITALVVLDAHPIAAGEAGPTLTFTKADVKLYDKYYVLGATIQNMDTGSTMSLHDALELMLVVSASNYAEAVSTWAFGSQGRFLSATATWLAENGLTGTTIVEPTGIDQRNTSTTTDLIAIGRLAMADPVIAEIVKSQFLDVPGFGPSTSTNDLLGVNGVNGIKTGTLEPAGSCLLFSADLDVPTGYPVSIIGVVLGGSSRSAVDIAVSELIQSIRSGFHFVEVINRGDVVGSFTTPWGDEATVVAGRNASLLTWSDTPVTASVVSERVMSASDGDRVGTVTFKAGSRTVSVPLVIDGTIASPDGWWRLTHPVELFSGGH